MENFLRQEMMSGPAWYGSTVQAEPNVYDHLYSYTPTRDLGRMWGKKHAQEID